MQLNANQVPAPQGPIDRPRSSRWKLLVFASLIILLASAARIAFWLPEEYRLFAHALILFGACHLSFLFFARPNTPNTPRSLPEIDEHETRSRRKRG